jgi:hypothetical protein
MGDATFNPVTRCLNSTLFERTKKRIEKIKIAMPEFTVVQLWEHDYNASAKNDPLFKLFISKNQGSSPLIPKDALRGGRVNSIKNYHKCSENEKIRYSDFCSLYPHVMRRGRYPLYQPEIITENFEPGKKYFGLIKCKIVAPRGLYFPILPFSCNGKLMFSLCHSCSLTQFQGFFLIFS